MGAHLGPTDGLSHVVPNTVIEVPNLEQSCKFNHAICSQYRRRPVGMDHGNATNARN